MAKQMHRAARAAAFLAKGSGHATAVAFVRDDGTGEGCFVQVGYAGISLADVEKVVSTMLREALARLEAASTQTASASEACLAQVDRLRRVVALLAADGVTPTGLTPETVVKGARH